MMMLTTIARLLLAVLFIAAGLRHFTAPDFYLRMMPPGLPWHRELVLVSGAAEVALGLMLLVPRLRTLARWGLIALLVAVFPANVQMALHPETFPEFAPAMLWARLPLQLFLIAWVWYATRRPVGT